MDAQLAQTDVVIVGGGMAGLSAACYLARASSNGDMQGLLNLLTDDIVLTTDGGGKVRAMPRPIYGPDKVVRGLFGILRKAAQDLQVRIEEVNGQLAFTAYQNDQLVNVLILELADERIRRIYLIANPDKLHGVR